MNWKYVLYPALVFCVALPLAIVVALFFTAGHSDLLYATKSVDARTINGPKVGAAYAYHLEAKEFVPTPLCYIDETTAEFHRAPAGFAIANTAGRAVAGVLSFIGVNLDNFIEGDFQNSDVEQKITWRKEYVGPGNVSYREECRDQIQAHLESKTYVVLRVSTVYLTAQTHEAAPQPTMVRFHPEPMTLTRCMDAPATDPVCKTSLELIQLVEAGWVTRLRAHLIRIEVA